MQTHASNEDFLFNDDLYTPNDGKVEGPGNPIIEKYYYRILAEKMSPGNTPDMETLRSYEGTLRDSTVGMLKELASAVYDRYGEDEAMAFSGITKARKNTRDFTPHLIERYQLKGLDRYTLNKPSMEAAEVTPEVQEVEPTPEPTPAPVKETEIPADGWPRDNQGRIDGTQLPTEVLAKAAGMGLFVEEYRQRMEEEKGGEEFSFSESLANNTLGEELAAKEEKEQAAEEETLEVPNFKDHVIGETSSSKSLYGIAKEYDMTVDELKEANGLTSNTIKSGQTLKIPDGTKIVNNDFNGLLEGGRIYEAYAKVAPAASPLVKYPEESKKLVTALEESSIDLPNYHDKIIKPMANVTEGFLDGKNVPFSLAMVKMLQEGGFKTETAKANNFFNIKLKGNLIERLGFGKEGPTVYDKSEGRSDQYIAFDSPEEAFFAFDKFLEVNGYDVGPDTIDYSKSEVTRKFAFNDKYNPKGDTKGIRLPRPMNKSEVIRYVTDLWKNSSDEKRNSLFGNQHVPEDHKEVLEFVKKDIAKHFVASNKDKIKNGFFKKGTYHMKPYVLVYDDNKLTRLEEGKEYSLDPYSWYAVESKNRGYATDVAYAVHLQNKIRSDKGVQEVIKAEREMYAKKNGGEAEPLKLNLTKKLGYTNYQSQESKKVEVPKPGKTENAPLVKAKERSNIERILKGY